MKAAGVEPLNWHSGISNAEALLMDYRELFRIKIKSIQLIFRRRDEEV
jgi:hypothetical protein